MSYDVICVGSALLDIFLKSDKFVKVPSGDFAGGVALCEEYGGKTEVDEVEVTTGGGGTNNAVSYARKGLRTGIIAELGKDLIASAVLEELRREGVDTSFLVQEKSEETGISSIMVSGDGGRSVAVYRGAGKMLGKEDIPWDELKPSWIHLSSLGSDMNVYEGIIGHAKHNGIKIAVNPGKHEIRNSKEWGGIKLFEGVDVLIMNREEAQLLTGLDLKDDNIWKSEACIIGPKICVITDGKRGGKVCASGECYFFEAEEAKTIEETGAGDAFGSGFVAGLMKGHDVEKSIEWGKKQAASVVSFMGAKRGLLKLEEIEN